MGQGFGLQCPSAAEREGNNLEGLNDFPKKKDTLQCQNLALTVLFFHFFSTVDTPPNEQAFRGRRNLSEPSKTPQRRGKFRTPRFLNSDFAVQIPYLRRVGCTLGVIYPQISRMRNGHWGN